MLDLEEKVVDFVYGVAEKHFSYVTWYDMEGKNPNLLRDPLKYKK